MKKSREQFLGRDERAELEVTRTEGSFVFDAKGMRYIDFMMGWCVGNFGWGNSVLVKEAKTYRGPDYIYPGYSCGAWEELARLLVSIAPSGLTKAFLTLHCRGTARHLGAMCLASSAGRFSSG